MLHQLRRWLRFGIGPAGVGEDVGLQFKTPARPNDRDVVVIESKAVSYVVIESKPPCEFRLSLVRCGHGVICRDSGGSGS